MNNDLHNNKSYMKVEPIRNKLVEFEYEKNFLQYSMSYFYYIFIHLS